MTEPSDGGAHDDPQPTTADEPYPWRNSEPDTSPAEPETEQDSSDHTQNPSPSREQVSNTNGRSRNNESHQEKRGSRGPRTKQNRGTESSVGGGGQVNTDASAGESSEPLQAKLILLVVGGLKKVWHAKVLGFYWLLPRVTGSTDPHEGLSGHFYPSNMIREDEEVVYSGNPSRWRFPGPYVIAGFLLLISAIISIAVPLGYGEPLLDAVTPSVLDLPVPEDWWYAPLLFVSIAALLLVYVVASRASTWHIITDKRLLHRENVLDPDRTRLDLVDMRSIDTREPLPDRWYGIGHIDIYTASTGGKEVTLEAVKGADSVATVIDKTRYQRQESLRSNDSDETDQHSQQAPDQQGAGGQGGPIQEKTTGKIEDGPPQHPSEKDATYPHGHGERSNEYSQGGSRGDSPSAPERGRGGGQTDPSSGVPPDQLNGEGDSIEQQRPGHSLRDDLDETTRREDS